MLSKYSILLRKILPPECLNHVEVANIRNQNLILITDSPVWTTRLRQLSPQILQFLTSNPVELENTALDNTANNSESSAQKMPMIHHVQITTRYKHSHHTAGSGENIANVENQLKPLPKISSKTAELLSQSAGSIDHQQLKTALLKIAAHAKDKSPKKPEK